MGFPSNVPSYQGFDGADTLAVDNHAAQHNQEQADISALANKIGTGASTPVGGTVLAGNGSDSSAWRSLTSSDVGLGNVTNASQSSIMQAVYPVGSIYTETTGVNPAATFGFGTWASYASGRVLVGNGTSDQAFAAGSTGGESNHILTQTEMPSHTHVQDSHIHTTTLPANSTGGGTGNYFAGNNSGSLAASSSATVATNQNTGGGASHNNLQPYVVVYYWQRTA